MAQKSNVGKTAMWGLMGLLFLGLGGFGAVNLSGNIRTLGSVGDKPVSVDTYARQIQQELRAISQQSGTPISFQQAQGLGLDRAVLNRIMRDRALDHEATEMGLSIGDELLRDRILEIPAFQGVDGQFDRDGYAQSLRSAGLNEGEFETSLREEAARQLLQGAILSGVEMPAAYAETLVKYVSEERDFTWVLLDEDTLDTPIEEADEATLKTYFEANADSFVLPASKRITFAWLNPTDIIDQVELPEEELRAEYEARAEQYIQPERRLTERLVFADQASADQAAAALEVGGTTFEALVEDRGLNLADIDLGDVAQDALGAAGEVVFGAEVGSVVGPADSDLGPALFRVNAVLPAQNVTFEEAEPELRDVLAADRAVRLVEAQAEDFDDRLAGGATLEQLAEETDMVLGQIDWTAESSESLAAYEAFRSEAAIVQEGDFPQIKQLDDGGIFAMRLNEALPERPATYEDVAQEVATRWREDEIVSKLRVQAEAAKTAVEGGATFPEQGLTERVVGEQPRSAFIPNTPTAFMSNVFEMNVGDIRLLEGTDTVVLVRLDAIAATEDSPEAQDLVATLREQQNEALARGLFEIFSADTLLRAGQTIDQRAVNAVNVNFQ
ncbi:peptidylprolyl isomerase [Sulfitobacter donghicola]|uniref:Peptidyl-prolyl cis-trans isomerase n=1 Tax=Sulfitobacter donghicola DSW-25 = KCTC 12864 = JCM 14565 TaxID=1300350 RepID=A0A073IVY6_9RHOB|nr:peptidylprolyl isomerase [Sulfitobacter donghicola]KEJ89507.1 peptidyl-prolyl cis-trans isomerase [Sulfitobacter donghicola DSW-25 = KCTC 12864 = JCM 14565]KIN69330.1 putative peptidyl-prolyl cis-trans isomerase [Sulfitobacter donghicola DSW-25 = KCTC 12864 = JCM 14565]